MNLFDFLMQNSKNNQQTGGAAPVTIQPALIGNNQYNENLANVQKDINANRNVNDYQFTEDYVQPRKTLYDFLTGAADKTQNTLGGLGEKINSGLFGKLIGNDTAPEVSNNNENASANISVSGGRQGGLLPDLRSGFNENYNNGFNIYNLQNNPNKGFAYRLGEGLGTLGRFAQSAPGRGLITAAIVGATGGNPLEAGVYGLKTAAGNQNLRMADSLYRKQLINSAKSSVMNSPEYQTMDENERIQALADAENGINNIKGYITPEAYKNVLYGQQLKDNADWKKLNLESQQNYQNAMLDFKKDEAEANRRQQAFENQLKREGMQIDWAKYQSDRDYKNAVLNMKAQQQNSQNQNDKNAKANLSKLNDINTVEKQLSNFEATFDKLPGKLNTNTLGVLAAKTGFESEQQANFESQRTLLFNKIARDLGGEKGVLSDQDIKRIENSLPRWTDSYKQKKAKMKAINDLLNIQKERYGNNLAYNNSQNINTSDEGWAF